MNVVARKSQNVRSLLWSARLFEIRSPTHRPDQVGPPQGLPTKAIARFFRQIRTPIRYQLAKVAFAAYATAMKPRAFEKAAKLPIVSPLFEIEELKATWDEESYDLKLRTTATTKLRRNTVYELRDLSAVLVDSDGNVVGVREGAWTSTKVLGGVVTWTHEFPKHYRKRAVSVYYVVNCEFEEIASLFRADVAPFSTDDDSRQVVELANRVSTCGDVDLDFHLETIRGEVQISVMVGIRNSGFYEFRCDRGLVRFLDGEGNPVAGTSLTFWTQPDAAILIRDATMKLHSRAASRIRKLEYSGRLGMRLSNLIGPIQIS